MSLYTKYSSSKSVNNTSTIIEFFLVPLDEKLITSPLFSDISEFFSKGI